MAVLGDEGLARLIVRMSMGFAHGKHRGDANVQVLEARQPRCLI
jgi:hypothetical protein